MTLSIAISSEVEAKLKAKAAVAGVDVATYAAKSLERLVARPSLDQHLAPLRAQVAASGIADHELTDLLEQVKHDARTKRRARRPV